MQDFSTLACDLDTLGSRAKGDDSPLALDVMRFVEKWKPIIKSMTTLPASFTAPVKSQKSLDLRGTPLDGDTGKIDSEVGG